MKIGSLSGSKKRVLRFYSSYPAPNADWHISLSPAQDPNNAATARPGFGVTDGAGNNWSVLAENVGMASSISQMHSLFMNSPSHRANIVNGSFDRIGTGVAESGGRLFVVQVFAG